MLFPESILLATANPHKSAEMKAILTPLLPAGVALLSLADAGLGAPPDSVESCATFTGNARAKAAWCRHASGLACIADDSGLCVDALGGAPGVRSARWAGPTDLDRNLRLLQELARAGAASPASRSARFVCSAAFAPADTAAEIVSAIGRVYGWILSEMEGDGGFGYDPLFHASEIGCTLAQATVDLKNRRSHRAHALRALCSCIC